MMMLMMYETLGRNFGLSITKHTKKNIYPRTSSLLDKQVYRCWKWLPGHPVFKVANYSLQMWQEKIESKVCKTANKSGL